MFEFIVFLYGAIIGSFLNVLIYRLPLGLSIIKPIRSYCPSCGYQIKWYENIPLLSYLFLKGSCSKCNEKIGLSYFVVELISGLLAVFIYLKLGINFDFFIAIILFYLLLSLSFIDLKYKAVPDYLLLLCLIVMVFMPEFNLINALIFAGGFVLLDFIITFYIQNIKAKITKNKELEDQVALGEGDIPIVAVIGGILGIKLGVLAIFLAAIFAIFPSIYTSITKKEIETPFIPYLTLGFATVYFFSDTFLNLFIRYGL
ncbi:MAG TPA: prepilin peptidase [Arcobacter sp.]|jgi:leader peptidase (prepilin peptidase)/N-methyltransferase|nr:prepilin peptidase [Arcobacter sp.]